MKVLKNEFTFYVLFPTEAQKWHYIKFLKIELQSGYRN